MEEKKLPMLAFLLRSDEECTVWYNIKVKGIKRVVFVLNGVGGSRAIRNGFGVTRGRCRTRRRPRLKLRGLRCDKRERKICVEAGKGW